MNDELYTDGVEEITVGGGIVRVDLVSLSPHERDSNNAPKRVFRQRLIFSIEAFANSVDVMQKAVQGLVEAGAIKRNAPQATGSPPQPVYDERRDPAPIVIPGAANVSSNFS